MNLIIDVLNLVEDLLLLVRPSELLIQLYYHRVVIKVNLLVAEIQKLGFLGFRLWRKINSVVNFLLNLLIVLFAKDFESEVFESLFLVSIGIRYIKDHRLHALLVLRLIQSFLRFRLPRY